MYILYVYSKAFLYMYFASRMSKLSQEVTLGDNQFATSCKCFGHVISNNLSDESDVQA